MISIIVPAYNVELTLPKTIDSILLQSYRDFEIIIVDDGSTDMTPKIADKYQEKYPNQIRVIHSVNQGVTHARLKGIDNAMGEWIGFVDADDFLEPDMYEILIKNAEEYDADISHCGYQMNFSDGRTHYFYNTGVLLIQNSHEALATLLEGTLVEPGLWNKIYRKQLIISALDSEQMDCSLKQNEDFLMNFLIFKEARCIVFLDVCKYHYVVREGSATRTALNKNMIYDPIIVRKQIVQIADELLIDQAKRTYISTCLDVYNLILMSGTKENREDLNAVWNEIQVHKEWGNLLNRKRKLLLWTLLHSRVLYKILYRGYSNYIQVKPYE
ncbi:glycosyltransferase family 2 protein [Butyricicoccus porcorum]|uniref:glycosyltransferase family 2 protein n=1 Tax=Butyricicoccus porcorum TaxID=1945634 RepID=UPI003F4ADC22